jgi:hypothetical protein
MAYPWYQYYGNLTPPVLANITGYQGIRSTAMIRSVCWHFRTVYDTEPVALALVELVRDQVQTHNHQDWLVEGGIRWLSDTLTRFSDNSRIISEVCHTLSNALFKNSRNKATLHGIPLIEQLLTLIQSHQVLTPDAIQSVLSVVSNLMMLSNHNLKYRVPLSKYPGLIEVVRQYWTEPLVQLNTLRLIRNSCDGCFPIHLQIATALQQAGAADLAWQCLAKQTTQSELHQPAIEALWNLYRLVPPQDFTLERCQLLIKLCRQNQPLLAVEATLDAARSQQLTYPQTFDIATTNGVDQCGNKWIQLQGPVALLEMAPPYPLDPTINQYVYQLLVDLVGNRPHVLLRLPPTHRQSTVIKLVHILVTYSESLDDLEVRYPAVLRVRDRFSLPDGPPTPAVWKQQLQTLFPLKKEFSPRRESNPQS